MQKTMRIVFTCLRQMSVWMKPKTYICSYPTPSVTYSSWDIIIKVASHLLMFVCGELKHKPQFFVSTELTPTNKAYLPLYKLVPVVIRKRSEKENEKGWFFILNIKENTSRNFSLWVPGSGIFLICVLLTKEFKIWLKFRVITGLLSHIWFHYFVLASETLRRPRGSFCLRIMTWSQELWGRIRDRYMFLNPFPNPSITRNKMLQKTQAFHSMSHDIMPASGVDNGDAGCGMWWKVQTKSLTSWSFQSGNHL